MPPDDLFGLTAGIDQTPDSPEDVTIAFERGTPVSVNGERLDPVALVAALNAVGGRHGVGRIDLVEDRLVGMKSRGVYETPGGTLLYSAHSELEQLVLDRRTLAAKDAIAPRYADLVYEGRWWTTEREACDAFVNVTQERVTGSVTLRLYKGNVIVAGRESAEALYDERFVTFGEDDVYEQSDAGGFIRLFALPARVRAVKDRELAAAAASEVPHDRPRGDRETAGAGDGRGTRGSARDPRKAVRAPNTARVAPLTAREEREPLAASAAGSGEGA